MLVTAKCTLAIVVGLVTPPADAVMFEDIDIGVPGGFGGTGPITAGVHTTGFEVLSHVPAQRRTCPFGAPT